MYVDILRKGFFDVFIQLTDETTISMWTFTDKKETKPE